MSLPSPARPLVLFALAALLVVAFLRWNAGAPTSPGVPEEPRRAAASRSSGEESSISPGEAGAVRLPATGARARPSQPGTDPGPGEGAAVWDLVAQLERLAQDPPTFHARALPVIERLTDACPTAPATGMAPLAERLVDEVVRAAERAPLVRGAVLLALSPRVSASTFRGVFDEWFLSSPEPPLELLRAASIAAAMRGEEAGCEGGISLAELAALGDSDSLPRPGWYPVRLTRLLEPYEAEGLRRWLFGPDARRDALRFSPEAAERELPPEQGEYVAACELLFALWGQRALVDAQVLAVVLREASLSAETLVDRPVVYLRAASFLLRSLAPCDARLRAAADGMAASEEELRRGLAEMVAGGIGGGLLSPAEIEQIASLRASPDEDAGLDLMLFLGDLAERYEAMEGEDREGLARDALVLADIALDPTLDEDARMSAIVAIRASGSWPALKRVTADLWRHGTSGTVMLLALETLSGEALESASKRAEAITMLEGFLAEATPGVLRRKLEGYLALLGKE